MLLAQKTLPPHVPAAEQRVSAHALRATALANRAARTNRQHLPATGKGYCVNPSSRRNSST